LYLDVKASEPEETSGTRYPASETVGIPEIPASDELTVAKSQFKASV